MQGCSDPTYAPITQPHGAGSCGESVFSSSLVHLSHTSLERNFFVVVVVLAHLQLAQMLTLLHSTEVNALIDLPGKFLFVTAR